MEWQVQGEVTYEEGGSGEGSTGGLDLLGSPPSSVATTGAEKEEESGEGGLWLDRRVREQIQDSL